MKDKKTIREIIWTVILIAGIIGWIVSINAIDNARAWRALLISFLFFVSFTGGMVVWPAVVIASNGKWMGKIEKTARTGIIFALPSLIILIVLWIGSSYWASWLGPNNPHKVWLSPVYIFLRDIISLIIFWAAAYWYLKNKNKENEKFSAGILVFIFCMVFSLLAFDLIMPLMPKWRSTLFGGYFFISALYIGIAAWTILSLLYQKPDANKKQDFGKLILTFCLLTTYMMFSQLITMWYENLPRETSYLVPRINYTPGVTISTYLLIGIYLGPFVLLIPVWSKVNTWFLGAVSILILVSMWIERWWLVSTQFTNTFSFGLPEIAAILALAGMTGLGIDLAFSSKLVQQGIPEQ